MTYADMARALSIDMCPDPLCGMRHEGMGAYTSDGIMPTVHFDERPMTKANMLAFLRLVARAQDPSLDGHAPWLRVYLINVRVRELARVLHIRNPAGTARMDRAFVLASVAGMAPKTPMRKRAYDWARRPKRMKEE